MRPVWVYVLGRGGAAECRRRDESRKCLPHVRRSCWAGKRIADIRVGLVRRFRQLSGRGHGRGPPLHIVLEGGWWSGLPC